MNEYQWPGLGIKLPTRVTGGATLPVGLKAKGRWALPRAMTRSDGNGARNIDSTGTLDYVAFREHVLASGVAP